MIKNKQKLNYKLCLILSVIFFLIFIYSINNFNSLNEFGGIIILLSLLISITSFIFIFIFRNRSKVIEETINSKKYIAQWNLTKNEWNKFLEEEIKIRKIESKLTFLILSILTIMIFGIFIILVPEKLIMFFIMIGLLIFYFIISKIIPRLNFMYKKNQKELEIFILEKGAIIPGNYHTWDNKLSKLNFVNYINKEFKALHFNYEFFDRLGIRNYDLIVPISKNVKKEKLLEIIKIIKAKNNIKK